MDDRDSLLYRGRLAAAVDVSVDADFVRMTGEEAMSARRARLAIDARLVLRGASSIEGWSVSLARWIWEAAATGSAQPGKASELLQSCRASLDPTVDALLED